MKRVVRAVFAVAIAVGCGSLWADGAAKWTLTLSSATAGKIEDGVDAFNVSLTAGSDALSVTELYTAKSATLDLAKPIEDEDGKVYRLTAVTRKYATANSVVTEVRLPETMTTLDSNAFANFTSLVKVDPFLPDSVVTINASAFSGCSKLSGCCRFSNPNLKALGNSAFSRCAKLQEIDFTGCGLESMGELCFRECTSLTNIVNAFPPTFKSFTTGRCFYSCSALKCSLKFTNPEFTSVPYDMFNGAKILSVDFGDCPIAEIGQNAFNNCTTLTNITPLLPGTVTTIGASAFYGCPLAGDLIATNPALKTIGSSAFQQTKISSVRFAEEGLETISQRAFRGITTLTNMVPFLPRTVKTIGDRSFYETTNLKIELDASSGGMVSTLAAAAFYSSGITGANFGNSEVTTIVSDSPFNNESGMKWIVFPKNISTIVGAVSIDALTNMTFVGKPPESIAANAFKCSSSYAMKRVICVPRAYKDEWESFFRAGGYNVQPLMAEERTSFRQLFPGAKVPRQKVKLASSYYQYLAYTGNLGFMLLVR